ncbi:hypothetical protein P154DRAFT_621714 [Amniculicola lignicola CBS 123094]|uniref:Uncharacterized protein n=1 Tax=Amniculicola lignicola CBS 123094 TaxID=1392246 RepID=A0A6A5W8V1_9PLEO|nr:hypothetical protein P154DRAFT_621714 [Amniculicola lignicola CBS 123094]
MAQRKGHRAGRRVQRARRAKQTRILQSLSIRNPPCPVRPFVHRTLIQSCGCPRFTQRLPSSSRKGPVETIFPPWTRPKSGIEGLTMGLHIDAEFVYEAVHAQSGEHTHAEDRACESPCKALERGRFENYSQMFNDWPHQIPCPHAISLREGPEGAKGDQTRAIQHQPGTDTMTIHRLGIFRCRHQGWAHEHTLPTDDVRFFSSLRLPGEEFVPDCTPLTLTTGIHLEEGFCYEFSEFRDVWCNKGKCQKVLDELYTAVEDMYRGEDGWWHDREWRGETGWSTAELMEREKRGDMPGRTILGGLDEELS